MSWHLAARICSGLVRVATFIVWILLIGNALPLYSTFKSTPGINDPPYSGTILVSLMTSVMAGIFGCIWTFLTWIPCWMATGFWALVIAWPDLFIVLCLFISVVLSPSWMLVSTSSCKTHNATTYNVPEGYPSVYVIASSVPLSNSSVGVYAEQNCEDFVDYWIIAFSLFIIWSLATASEFYLGTYKTFTWPWPDRKQLPPEASTLERIRYNVTITVTYPPKFFIALLPKKVHARTWLLYRVCCKALQAIKRPLPGRSTKSNDDVSKSPKSPQALAPMIPLTTYALSEKKPPQPPTKPTIESTLSKLLYWDILLLLSSHLHYADVIALSLVSRTLRQTIFPPESRTVRLALLRKYTLDAESVKACDVCGIPTCDDCRRYRRISERWQDHVGSCQVWCGKCYSRYGNIDRGSRRGCECDCASGNALCGICFSGKDDESLVRERDERLERVLAERASVEGACGRCGAELEWGVRWWVCSSCMKECGCSLHPGWSWPWRRRRGARDDREKGSEGIV